MKNTIKQQFMKNLHLLLNAVVCLILQGCYLQKNADTYIDIPVKDHLKIENKGVNIIDFIFSPYERNKIWTFNSNTPTYELNLSDSSWITLNDKFGIKTKPIWAQAIFKDSEDENLIWISDQYQGLFAYNHEKDTLLIFKTSKPVLVTSFLKNCIVAGTCPGIYIIDRKDFSIHESKSMADINIKTIEKTDNDLLLINNDYEFQPENDKIIRTRTFSQDLVSVFKKNGVKLTTYRNNTLAIETENSKINFSVPYSLIDLIIVDESIVWIPTPYLWRGIIKYDFIENKIDSIPLGIYLNQFKRIEDSDLIWFYNGGTVLCFDKTNSTSKIIRLNERIHNLKADKKYIYFNTYNSIEIYEKQYLLQKGTDASRISTEVEDFENYFIVNDINRMDFKTFYPFLQGLQKRFSSTENEMIKSWINGYTEGIWGFLPYDFASLIALERYVMDSVEEDRIKALYYLKVVKLANHSGRLNSSLYYDSLLMARYPESRDEYYVGQMAEVAKSKVKIDSILNVKQSVDKRLWSLGKAYFELFSYVGPVTEASSFDMTYPFTYFDTLLRHYPASEYADDAEYLILTHNEGGSHEGGDNSYNLTAIELYKAFLKKYPGTEFTPEIYYLISSLYEYCESTFTERKNYLKLGLQYIDSIKKEYPVFAEQYKVTNLENILLYYLDRAMWQLHIKAEKQNYEIGEPINISFELKNIDHIQKKIRLLRDKELSNFVVEIVWFSFDEPNYNGQHCYFKASAETFNKELADTLIGPGESYTETLNICSTLLFNNGQHGSFSLDRPGRYRIQTIFADYQIDLYVPSNELWINIGSEVINIETE